MARNLLADGRAEDVMRMVEPLVTSSPGEDPRGDRAFLTALLARVHAVHTGDVERALTLLAPFEEADARAAWPEVARAQVALWLGWAHARRDETFDEEARALTLFDEAQHLFDAELDANGRCWAHLGRAHAYFRIDEYQLMRAELDEAASIRRTVRDVQADRWFHDLRVAACRFQGRYDDAQRHIDALADWGREAANREVQGRARAYQAALYLDLGYAPERIIETAKHAVALLRDVTAEAGYPLLAAYHAHIRALILQGDWSASERTIEGALRDVGARPTSRAHLNTLQARLALRRNQPAAAHDIMEQLFAQAHRLPHGLQRSHVALLRGELLAIAGQLEKAYSWIRRAHQNARETGHRGNQLRTLLTEARVALDGGDSDRVNALLDALERYGDYFSVLPFAASRFHLLAGYHEARGRLDTARAAYEQARSAYALIGDAYHLAHTQCALAALASESPEASGLLDDAVDTFERLDLHDDADAAREQRTTLPTASDTAVVDLESTLGMDLARASSSPRLVAEAWIRATERLLPDPWLPDQWLGVYRYTEQSGWTCVHEHGTPPSDLSYPPAPDCSHAIQGIRWVPLHGEREPYFAMGLHLSDATPEAWAEIDTCLAPWRPVVQLALDRAMMHQQYTAQEPVTIITDEPSDLKGFVYESTSMRSIAQRVHRIRASHSPVLITGESGSGKTTVARAIHKASERHDGPWHVVNCASAASTPLGGQLFGRDDDPASSLLRRADGGTLLLQSIDALPLDTQSKLLQVLNAGELFSPGAGAPVPVDVRIVASTSEDIHALVRAGRFRRDLYHQLHVISLHVPPLRERPADVPALARHFAATLAPSGAPPVTITNRALEALLHYHWPGNVRQLRNTIERALSFTASEPAPTIDLPVLSEPVRAAAPPPSPQPRWSEILRPDCDLDDVLARTETEIIERVLTECDGQITASADMLGLTRQGLYKKMKRLSIDPASFKQEVAPSALAS